MSQALDFYSALSPHTAFLGSRPLLRESRSAFLNIEGDQVLGKNCISQTQVFTQFKNVSLTRCEVSDFSA